MNYILAAPIFGNNQPNNDDRFAIECKNDNDIKCFYKVVDHMHNGQINTKVQIQPFRRFYRQKCGRARQLCSIYNVAPDQNSEECRNAFEFDKL